MIRLSRVESMTSPRRSKPTYLILSMPACQCYVAWLDPQVPAMDGKHGSQARRTVTTHLKSDLFSFLSLPASGKIRDTAAAAASVRTPASGLLQRCRRLRNVKCTWIDVRTTMADRQRVSLAAAAHTDMQTDFD